jgi:hypothetical protein
MFEACILFADYKNDEVTRKHLDVIRELNPYPVIAVRDQSDDGTKGPIRPLHYENPWRGADSLIYTWFAQREFDAARYIFLEWDCLMTLPVREYYADVWEVDAAARIFATPDTHRHWRWFEEIDRLPVDLRPSAAGLIPLNGILLSHDAMLALTTQPLPPEIFCELRLGTLLRAKGIDAVPLPSERGANNSFASELIHYDPAMPDLYHPIKSCDPLARNLSLCMSPPKTVFAAMLLAKLALGSDFSPRDFSKTDACRCLEKAGWSRSASVDQVDFFRDNGVIFGRPTSAESSLYFNPPGAAEFLAAGAYALECGTNAAGWSDLFLKGKHAAEFQRGLRMFRKGFR